LRSLTTAQVPLNPAFNSLQVISALSHLSASHLIIGMETNLPYKPPRENVTLLEEISADIKTAIKVRSESVPSLQTVVLVDNSNGRINPLRGVTPFNDLFLGQSSAEIKGDVLCPDDIINIQFTSGTTSMPKAACLTHTGILNNGFFIGERMGLTPKDIVCCPPPLFHCFGCILGYMATATHGSSIVFPSDAFNPEAALRAVQEERATALYGVSTMFVSELELIANGTVPNAGFERLRTGIAAGSSIPSTLMKKLHETLNLKGLTICYGMTETSPVSCMTTPDDPLVKRIDSVGRLLPHVEARVVDIHDRSRILPINEKGELAVSGYLVMKGYWRDDERTKEVRIVERDPKTGEEKIWMHTGDEAVMNEEGYVKITGRIKDLIIRGGENIHPLEIENVLFAHPSVSEASVVGLPDERYSECVAAFIVVHHNVVVGDDGAEVTLEKGKKLLTKEELRTWVRERLSNHLVPKYIFWTQEYPKTASGKIQKFILREDGIRLAKQGKGL
jgi:acyl-CoA synthetase (AMP-forming)/AMP-acid ligase II